MNGGNTRLDDMPSRGKRKGYYVRVKRQRDATFIGTVLGGDPAKPLIEALKEEQKAEESTETDRLQRKLDLIATDISRNKAEAERVAEAVVRYGTEEEDLLKRQEAIEETLAKTKIAIVEKSGEILKARPQHALKEIKQRRALDELRRQSKPKPDQQALEALRSAREHEERLFLSLRGYIFSRPIAILLILIGAVGLVALGWWTGERIRSMVDMASLAASPMLSTFVGMVFCAVIAGATALCVVPEIDVRDGERSSPLSRSVPRSFRWAFFISFSVVVFLEGVRMVRIGAYDLFTLDHAFVPILMTPLVSICLLWGAVCLGRHHEFGRAHAEVKRLSDELDAERPQAPRDGVAARVGRVWAYAIALFKRDRPPSETRAPYITKSDLDFSPQLVAEHDALVAGKELHAEELGRVRRELESVKAKRQDARESLERLHEVSAEMQQRRGSASDEHHHTLVGIRRRYREQLASLELARSMGIQARNLPDADALRDALAGRESNANGETGT